MTKVLLFKKMLDFESGIYTLFSTNSGDGVGHARHDGQVVRANAANSQNRAR